MEGASHLQKSDIIVIGFLVEKYGCMMMVSVVKTCSPSSVRLKSCSPAVTFRTDAGFLWRSSSKVDGFHWASEDSCAGWQELWYLCLAPKRPLASSKWHGCGVWGSWTKKARMIPTLPTKCRVPSLSGGLVKSGLKWNRWQDKLDTLPYYL